MGRRIYASGAVLLGYAATSTFFWHFPHFLHKRKQIPFSVAHISHRGGSAEGYENTLKIFRNAVNKGANMLELDVRLTKDHQVVVFHDKTLARMAGLDSNVIDVDYDALPKLKASVPIDTIPGEFFFDPSWTEEERRIPLLREVFAEFPDIPINIDIKEHRQHSHLLIDKVSKLISDFGRAELTVWGSFNNKVCQQLYSENPDICLFFSVKRVLVIVACAVTGLLPFIPIKETHYEVFLPMYMKSRRLRKVAKLSRPEKFLLWICKTFLVWKPLINHLKRRGIHVYLWVCNDIEEFRECERLGVTGIMTDKPTLLRDFLNSSKTKE